MAADREFVIQETFKSPFAKFSDLPAAPTLISDSTEFRDGPHGAFKVGRGSQKNLPSRSNPIPYYIFSTVLDRTPPEFEVNYGDGWFRRECGGWHLSPPGAQFQLRGKTSGHFERLILGFSETVLQQLAGELFEAEGSQLRRLPSRELHDPYLSALIQQLWAQSNFSSLGGELMMEGLFIAFLGRLLTLGDSPKYASQLNERGAEMIVRRATDFLRENLTAKVSLSDVAAAAHVSRPYLTRVFKKVTGRTVHDHLLELRVNRAKELITYFGRNLTLTEIASQCGFANRGHLTQVFTRILGVPPQQFRNQS